MLSMGHSKSCDSNSHLGWPHDSTTYRIPAFFISLMLLLALSTCDWLLPTSDDNDSFGSISGLVLDQETEQPIIGAVVSAIENAVYDTTDSLGLYLLDSLSTGLDTIVVKTEIYEAHSTIINITSSLQDLNFLLNRLPCFNDRPAEDTTRFYYMPHSMDTLLLEPSIIFARFDPQLQDTAIMLNVIREYGLHPLYAESPFIVMDGGQYTALLCVPESRRAEYYFTPYGLDNYCNFGSDPMVEYAFGVFNHGWRIIYGRISFDFSSGFTETQIDSFYRVHGLRYLYTRPGSGELGPYYYTVVTKLSKSNVLDLSRELLGVPFIDELTLGWATEQYVPWRCW